MQAALLRVLTQAPEVSFTERFQMTEHQRRRLFADSDFNLRDARTCLQLPDQLREFRQMPANRRVQHLATRQIRDIGRTPLAKSNQYPALLDDVLHTQPCLAAVSPRRTGQGRQHALRADTTDTLQVVEQHLLLGAHLCRGLQVLQAAAAAHAEMRTFRFHPVSRSHVNIGDARLVESLARRQVLKADLFTGQRALYEHGLAINMRNTAPVVGQ